MITIVRGNEKIVCSYKTYDEQFKQLGYVLASEPKKKPAKNAEVVVEKEVKEETNEEEKIGSKYGVKRRNTTKKEA